jgi:hypothetical protein
MAASISASAKASLSAVRDIRSKRSVSSSTDASPRARTSAMIAATASSTSGASSRFIDRSAVNAVSKSASVVFRNTGIRSSSARLGPVILLPSV